MNQTRDVSNVFKALYLEENGIQSTLNENININENAYLLTPLFSELWLNIKN